jgi:hypothetical protein
MAQGGNVEREPMYISQGIKTKSVRRGHSLRLNAGLVPNAKPNGKPCRKRSNVAPA